MLSDLSKQTPWMQPVTDASAWTAADLERDRSWDVALSESERDTIDDQIRELRGQIEDAQAKGDSKRANQLYQREQALIAKKDGRAPVVGAAGRAA